MRVCVVGERGASSACGVPIGCAPADPALGLSRAVSRPPYRRIVLPHRTAPLPYRPTVPQLVKLGEVDALLHSEYTLRRRMLVERAKVTLRSLMCSPRLEGEQQQVGGGSGRGRGLGLVGEAERWARG